MPLIVRGRHIGKDVFKPGERCQVSGTYRCDNCGRRDQTVEVEVAAKAIFPMCATCDDWDMGWRLYPAS